MGCGQRRMRETRATFSGRWRVRVKKIWQRTFGAAAVSPGDLSSEPRFVAAGLSGRSSISIFSFGQGRFGLGGVGGGGVDDVQGAEIPGGGEDIL